MGDSRWSGAAKEQLKEARGCKKCVTTGGECGHRTLPVRLEQHQTSISSVAARSRMRFSPLLSLSFFLPNFSFSFPFHLRACAGDASVSVPGSSSERGEGGEGVLAACREGSGLRYLSGSQFGGADLCVEHMCSYTGH